MKHLFITLSLALAACTSSQSVETKSSEASSTKADAVKATPVKLTGQKDTAIFAGGCFWCVEYDFEHLPGVYQAVSGYSGGDLKDPTYRDHGKHLEVVKVIFDPTIVSYEQLLEFYWTSVDPTDPNGQFCDQGNAYKTAIYARPNQIAAARASKVNIEATKPFSAPIVTPVLPAKTFWDAETYHQDYYKKNPVRYKRYRKGCGRDIFLDRLWKK